MLVLTRKLGESIIIGDDIKVKVIGISGKQIKLGIEAPLGIPVFREEIFKKVKRENILASNIDLNINEIVSIFGNEE